MRRLFPPTMVVGSVGFLLPTLLLSVMAGCFRDPDVGKITCNKNEGCPWGYACAKSGQCCTSANGTTCDNDDEYPNLDGSLGEVGGTISIDSSAVDASDAWPLDGTTIDASRITEAGAQVDASPDMAIDAGSVATDAALDTSDGSGSDAGWDVATDVPLLAPQDAGSDGSSTICTSPKVSCNGQCIDPTANECCIATDCAGICMTCSTSHVCTAAKSQDDPSQHCTGTCDSTGACKTKQGQTCKATTECVSGMVCADGYCCDSACTGSCQACDVSTALGTCTTLTANTAPHATHPACTGTDVCAGKCSGTSSDCTYPTATTTCGTASCTGSTTYQGTGTCSAGTCGLPSVKTCTNSACVVEKGGCTGECAPTNLGCSSSGVPQVCDSNGVWQNQTACLTGFTCSSGACTCATGKTNCTTACTDLQTDASNCGTCGHDCLGGSCSAGACQPVAITGALSTPPQVFGVDSQYVYFLVASSTTTQALDAYKIAKTAVGGSALFIATSGVMGDFAGVIGSTLFQYDSGRVPSDMTIGSSSGFSPLALTNSGSWLAMWRSVAPRYYAQTNSDHSSIYSISWYTLANSLIATHSESTMGIAPTGGSVSYDLPYAGGDSVYWLRTTYDASFSFQSASLFTASATNTTAIQLASSSGSTMNIIDVNAKSVLLTGGSSNELYRVALPATSSTGSPQYVTNIGSINAVEDDKGVYWIDGAYSIYRCGADNCSPSKVRLATDQPTQCQAHTVSTLYQDDTALYWGRSSSVTGAGANQIMRLAK
jgi:hypothetical protein